MLNPAYKEEELEFALRTVSTVPLGLQLIFRDKGIHYDAQIEWEIACSSVTAYCAVINSFVSVICRSFVETCHHHQRRSILHNTTRTFQLPPFQRHSMHKN